MFIVLLKVHAPQFGLVKIGDIINDEDGVLKEAIKAGDLQEVVEVVSSVCSILNYMERSDKSQLENGDLTEDKETTIKDEKDTRMKV